MQQVFIGDESIGNDIMHEMSKMMSNINLYDIMLEMLKKMSNVNKHDIMHEVLRIISNVNKTPRNCKINEIEKQCTKYIKK